MRIVNIIIILAALSVIGFMTCGCVVKIYEAPPEITTPMVQETA